MDLLIHLSALLLVGTRDMLVTNSIAWLMLLAAFSWTLIVVLAYVRRVDQHPVSLLFPRVAFTLQAVMPIVVVSLVSSAAKQLA